MNDLRQTLAETPGWVKWVAIPLIAVVVFGGLIGWLLGVLIGLLFKVLVFVALAGGLVYCVRRVSGRSSASDGARDRW